jgi:hypothetical protein
MGTVTAVTGVVRVVAADDELAPFPSHKLYCELVCAYVSCCHDACDCCGADKGPDSEK